ncbi:MAG: hypothetical protein LCH20_00115 [Proteobacteria bacterium]|nr:hypothetical protein [Pseudomonadota bacterium]
MSEKAKDSFKNWKIKRFKTSIIFGIVVATVAGWSSWYKEEEFKFNDDGLILIFLFTACVYYFVRLRSSLKNSGNFREYKIAERLAKVIILMFKSGFNLKNISGNTYVFELSNTLSANTQMVVKDCGEYCLIIGHQDQFEILGIETLGEEFEKNRNDQSNNRQCNTH